MDKSNKLDRAEVSERDAEASAADLEWEQSCERLLNLPHIKASLLEVGSAGLPVSEELVLWVIRECFSWRRRADFVEDAEEVIQSVAAMIEKGPTREGFEECRQDLTDRFATAAACGYLLGAIAGALGVMPDPAGLPDQHGAAGARRTKPS